MANQDSGHILVEGFLTSTAIGSVYQNVTFQASGEGFVTASGVSNSDTFTSMRGIGSMSVSGSVLMSSGSIQMSGSLLSTLSEQVLVSAYITMYGFLSANISTYSSVFCADMTVEFSEQVIESTGCTIGDESVELKRYRGDTYPVSTKLSKNGNTDVTGSTFQMSTQIGAGTIYTVAGIIENAELGIVNFPLDVLATGTAGVGVYDIEGNDGTYIYTYEKGVFTLLDDVTA